MRCPCFCQSTCPWIQGQHGSLKITRNPFLKLFITGSGGIHSKSKKNRRSLLFSPKQKLAEKVRKSQWQNFATNVNKSWIVYECQRSFGFFYESHAGWIKYSFKLEKNHSLRKQWETGKRGPICPQKALFINFFFFLWTAQFFYSFKDTATIFIQRIYWLKN